MAKPRNTTLIQCNVIGGLKEGNTFTARIFFVPLMKMMIPPNRLDQVDKSIVSHCKSMLRGEAEVIVITVSVKNSDLNDNDTKLTYDLYDSTCGEAAYAHLRAFNFIRGQGMDEWPCDEDESDDGLYKASAEQKRLSAIVYKLEFKVVFNLI